MQPQIRVECQSQRAVGNAVVDRQRQVVGELCKQIAGHLDPAAKDAAHGVRQDLLQQLLSSLERCFQSEEAWLAAQADPLLGRHTEEHAVYLAGLRNLVEMDRRGKTNPHVLREWLSVLWAEHMLKADYK